MGLVTSSLFARGVAAGAAQNPAFAKDLMAALIQAVPTLFDPSAKLAALQAVIDLQNGQMKTMGMRVNQLEAAERAREGTDTHANYFRGYEFLRANQFDAAVLVGMKARHGNQPPYLYVRTHAADWSKNTCHDNMEVNTAVAILNGARDHLVEHYLEKYEGEGLA